MQKIDALHAAGHTKRCGDGCEDGDDEVDDHLPGLLLCLCTHDKSVLIIWIKKWFACLGN